MPRPDSGFLSGILAGIQQFKQTRQFYQQMETSDLQQERLRSANELAQLQIGGYETPGEAGARRTDEYGERLGIQDEMRAAATQRERDERFGWYDVEGIPEGHSLNANADLVRNQSRGGRGSSGDYEHPSKASRRMGLFYRGLETKIDNVFFDYNRFAQADWDAASRADPKKYYGTTALRLNRIDLHWTTVNDLQDIYEKQDGIISDSRVRGFIDADIAMFGTWSKPSADQGWLTALANEDAAAFADIQTEIRGLISGKMSQKVKAALAEHRRIHSTVEYDPYQTLPARGK